MTCESPANLPPKQTPTERFSVPFVAIKTTVMRGSEHIALAVSHTMARRIARALNKHKPNEKGY